MHRAAPEAQPAEPTPPVERSDLAPPKDEPVAPPQAVIEPAPPRHELAAFRKEAAKT